MLIEHGLHITRASAIQALPVRTVQMARLQDRILFSASAIAPIVAELADAGSSLTSAMFASADAQNGGLFAIPDQQLLDLVGNSLLPAQAESQTKSESAASDDHTQELVFLDSFVSNLDQMKADLQAASANDPSRTLEFVVLDSTKDGIAQITSALLRYNGVDGIHIVSHGGTGQVQLGSTWLSINNLDTYRNAISAWQYSMSEKADILFYGCNLAGSEDGQQLLQEMSLLTDCDVAASENATGSVNRNADWNLEYQIGTITTDVAFSSGFQADADFILATYTVTNTNDSGAGSLRQAILDANSNVGADSIVFNISGTGVHTINVGSSLTITDAVTIDATTDDSFAANSNRPAIILDGNNSFTGDGFVLTSTADGTTIRGFVIRDFSGDGIEIQANSNGNTIAGNYIGRMTASGMDAGGGETNTGYGINVLGANNTIGGTTAADRNVISGNTSHGIYITGASATGNVVAGNYIGLLADGATAPANAEGVNIFQASSNTIGGATTAHRNIISGNTSDGVQISTNSNNNIFQNNYIGTDVIGTLDRGNSDDGVDIDTNSTGNQILNNLISGKNSQGIDLDSGASSTIIQGNLIGTQADGTSSLGNWSHGILVIGSANTITIGGTTVGQGNTIAFNGADGVYVSAGTAISIQGNSIYSNTGLGIDLGTNGITANDTGDGDAGANGLQNFPVITSATSVQAGTTLVGSLNSNTNTTYRVEFFSNCNNAGDATNHGEAERYLGFTTVTTDGWGDASFNFTLANAWVNNGDQVTATATVDLGSGNFGSTSEFAQNRIATSTGIIVVDTTSDVSDGTTSSINNLGNSRGADNRHSLREAIAAANNTANVGGNPDKIVFAIPGPLGSSTSYVINVGSALPTLTQATIIDGTTQSGYVAGSFMPIVIGGNNTGNGLVLSATADGATIRGLVIRDFANVAVSINGGSDNNTIAGNWIGQFNSDGSDAGAGEANANWGIGISGANNVIGGTTAADRNVISENLYGIFAANSTAADNTISGNCIGTDITGNAIRGTQMVGVYGIDTGSNNTIGGSTVSHRNIFAGTSYAAIMIDGENSDGNVIRNNTIGLGANGTTVLGVVGDGILITGGGDNTTIGGIGMGNTIVGATWHGIYIDGNTTGTVIQGNFIGTNAARTVTTGNGGNAIRLESIANSNTIGGTTAGQGNTILNSGTGGCGTAGVALASSGSNNSVRGNSIFGSNSIGIDLGMPGINTNDMLDADTGANDLQNFPEISSVTTNGTTVTVSGTLNSTANTTGILVDLYATPSGNINDREGARYLGSTTVATDGSGNATFSNVSLTGLVAIGEYITATATRSTGITSEFSANFTATGPNAAPTAVTDTATATETGGIANGTSGTNPTGNVLTNDTDIDSGDTKTVSGVAAGVQASAAGSIASSVTGTFGSITIAADGCYPYAVDNSNATVQALRTTANTITDVFTYTMRDTAGLTSTTQITVTIQGANDTPYASNDGTPYSANQGITFQGGEDTIALNSLAVNTATGTSVTVDFWMRWDGTDIVMPFGFGAYDLFFSGISFGFNTGNSDIYGMEASSLANSWRHIAAVFYNGDATQSQLYVDGVQQTLTQRVGAQNTANAYAASSAMTSSWTVTTGHKCSGQLDELRIWNGVRSANDIRSMMYRSVMSAEANLVAGYNFDNATTATNGIVDVSGNNRNATMSGMSAANIVSTNWTRADMTVAENASISTIVGSIRGSDYDGDDTLTYTLTDNASGRFSINSATGVLSVANGTLLNFEASTNHQITVRVIDTAGATYDQN